MQKSTRTKLCISNICIFHSFRNTPAYNFIKLYEYHVVGVSKFKNALLESSSFRKLKAFQLCSDGVIKIIEIATYNEFCLFDVRVKASLKKCQCKVLVFNSNGLPVIFLILSRLLLCYLAID